MFVFSFVEDYLELLAGFRNISNSKLSPLKLFTTKGAGPISLARYDVNIVHSLAESTITGKSLTDKQADLAIVLINKYKRQFLKIKVDTTSIIDTPVFRNPIRIIDRSKQVYIENNSIVVKFPYERKLVQFVSTASKNSEGSFKFDPVLKVWNLAITESNVSWACSLSKSGFDIDTNLLQLMQEILVCEQQNFKIELSVAANTVTISNAEPSLVEYIKTTLNGFDKTNLITLVDNSALLGYTVDTKICKEFEKKYNNVICELLLNKDSHYPRLDDNSNAKALLDIKEYATITNRWPIFIYDPGPTNLDWNTLQTLFNSKELLKLDKKSLLTQVDLTGVKCVYFNKISRAESPQLNMPILLSTVALLPGINQRSWSLNADKIVYYTASVYDEGIKKIASNHYN